MDENKRVANLLAEHYQKGREEQLEDIFELIDKSIGKYKRGKLKDSNFTVEDRAVAMVVLEVIKEKLTTQTTRTTEVKA